MKTAQRLIIVLSLIIAGALLYWFWVPDVGALRTWNEFLELPPMECTIGEESVAGLSGTMYVAKGRLRADYKVEGNGISSTFHTVVYEDGSTYTWADNIPFAEKGVLNLGDASTEANLFSISRCRRVWSVNPSLFVLPANTNFVDRASTVETAPVETTEN